MIGRLSGRLRTIIRSY